MNLHTRMAMKQEVPDDVQPEIAVAMAPRPAGAWVEGFDHTHSDSESYAIEWVVSNSQKWA